MDRRSFLTGAAALAACRNATPPPARSGEPGVVRVASVKTAVEGGLLAHLVERFEAAHPLRVQIATGSDVYVRARAGEADLVISHFGHHDAEQFVLDGRGEWPRTVFSNQMALLGPPDDPAQIRGLVDAGEAMRRIASRRSPFVLNDLDGVRYLSEILWHAAGAPDRAGWWIDDATSRGGAIERAGARGGYTLWGLTPFLRTPTAKLEPLVLADPLLQRMLVSVVVRGGNADAAYAFQSFLLAPATQASIRTVEYPGANGVHWVPAGRHNRTAILPSSRVAPTG